MNAIVHELKLAVLRGPLGPDTSLRQRKPAAPLATEKHARSNNNRIRRTITQAMNVEDPSALCQRARRV